MQGLLDRVPDADRTPLYILPQNETLVSRFFPQREAGKQSGRACRVDFWPADERDQAPGSQARRRQYDAGA